MLIICQWKLITPGVGRGGLEGNGRPEIRSGLLQHTKYRRCEPPGFREVDFFKSCFHIISQWKLMTHKV